MTQLPADKPPVESTEDESLPFFRSWRGVYWFVFGCFVFYVVALAMLTRAFS